ncbi:3-oxoacyl-ACP synthase III [bacterium]|nr:3-oxoacyl-ACP synthase III [bacterium]
MKFQHVSLECFASTLPDEIVTSDEIEERLRPVYERLNLPAGRLELMTGIRERRFFPRGTRPGQISAATANKAINASGIPREQFGAMIHGSVCRDQLEPATAAAVHQATGLPGSCAVFDVSNACLGLLNGVLLIASMIELGQIRAGVVVGTEDGRSLVEGTIDTLLRSENLTRQSIKGNFASLTIGSASAAIVVCDRRLSRTGNRLLGAHCLADTSHCNLCEGGSAAETFGDDRPRMQTDSEALLHAGIDLATRNWEATRRVLGWNNKDVDKAFTHQVGKAHRRLLYESLDLSPEIDFPTVEFLGNTGAAALPATAALGIEQGHLTPNDRVALLGIGSGLNSIMLGWEFHGTPT